MITKTYILDTNVLLSDTSAIYSFEENDVVIPLVVLEELDKQKSRVDEIGRNARQIARELDSLRTVGSNLSEGVKLSSNGATGLLRVMSSKGTVSLPHDLQKEKADNQIIQLAAELQKSTKEPVILVSKDINVRVKCDSLGIRCEDYLRLRAMSNKDDIYRGVIKFNVSADIVNSFHELGGIHATSEITGGAELYPNQFIVLKNEDGPTSSAIGRYVELPDGEKYIMPFSELDSSVNVFGLTPKNKEQRFALNLLLDKNIPLVTLVGPAGTGKTLLACAAGLSQVSGIGGMESAPYSKLIITRPIQPLGNDIGYLPGTLEEKMDPWIAPLKDSLNFLFGGKTTGRKRDEHMLALHMEKKKIEVEALTYIRGRSIPKAFIIIDEAQNLSMHELKTIITRVSEGTKIVLTGDIEQIDNTHVDVYTNGLTFAVEKFKNYPISGHISLIKGERSALATLASQIL